MMSLALGLANGADLEMQADFPFVSIFRSEQRVRDEAVDRFLCGVYGVCYTTRRKPTT